MIIVSQDKTDIINFNNISWLYIEPIDSSININLKYGYSILIAKYKTLKRAKEVLQEIINNYSNSQIVKLPNMRYEEFISSEQLAKFMCYEMPEE